VKSAALCAALLLAGPALADPPVHAPAALQEEAQNELWATRLSEAHARRDTARQRELEAVQALGSARHRRHPRGETLARLEGDLARARRERAQAEAELPELLEQARRDGVWPGVLRRFEPDDG
jgi:small-conductance mechanosensitive channel